MQNAKCVPFTLNLNITCDKHQQPIVGVLTDISNGKHLKCFCCVQDENLNSKQLVNLNQFQQQTIELQSTLAELSKVKLDTDLQQIDYTDNIEQLKHKIEQEKKCIRYKLDVMIKKITQACNDKYKELADLLDNELNNINTNIKTYNSILTDCLGESSFDQVLKKFENSNTQEESEKLMSEYMTYYDFSKASKHKAFDDQKGLTEKMKQIKIKIAEQIESISKPSFIQHTIENIEDISNNSSGVFKTIKILPSIHLITLSNIKIGEEPKKEFRLPFFSDDDW